MNYNEQVSTIPQSLDELVSSLSEGERTTYSHIIRTLKLPNNIFKEYASWSKECYTRNCIAENEKFELILLCWEQGQFTPIHDHGGEECWVKVIDGELRETIYQQNEVGKLKIIKTNISKSNDVSYMKDFMGFHRLENISPKRSMTLHLYAKPIRNCNIFDEKSKTFINKEMCYDTTN